MLSCAWKRHHRPRDSPANPKCSSCGHLREDESPVFKKKRILWTIWVTPQELTKKTWEYGPPGKRKIIFQSTNFKVLYINLWGFEALGGVKTPNHGDRIMLDPYTLAYTYHPKHPRIKIKMVRYQLDDEPKSLHTNRVFDHFYTVKNGCFGYPLVIST